MSVADAAIADGALVQVTKQPTKENPTENAARALLAEFGTVKGNSDTRLIVSLAMSGLTVQEYANAERRAIELSAQVDKNSGWQPPKDATGRAKYGPKQSSMASAASTRRQLFGALKHAGIELLGNLPPSGVYNPDTLPAFAHAVNLARAYLKDRGIDWTGQKTEDARRDRQTRAETKTWQQARDMAEAQNPIQPGENRAQWAQRVQEAIPDIEAELIDAARAKIIQAKADALFKELGVNGTADLIEALSAHLHATAKA